MMVDRHNFGCAEETLTNGNTMNKYCSKQHLHGDGWSLSSGCYV